MTAFLALIPTPVKYAAVALFAVLLAYNAGKWRGASQADAAAKARAAKATIEQLRERGMINEAVKDLSDCELIRDLGGMCPVDGVSDG